MLALFLSPSSLCQYTHGDSSWVFVFLFTTWNSVHTPGFEGIALFLKIGGGRTQRMSKYEKSVYCWYWSSIWQPFFIQYNALYGVFVATVVDICTCKCAEKELTVNGGTFKHTFSKCVCFTTHIWSRTHGRLFTFTLHSLHCRDARFTPGSTRIIFSDSCSQGNTVVNWAVHNL